MSFTVTTAVAITFMVENVMMFVTTTTTELQPKKTTFNEAEQIAQTHTV